jgi:Glycosyl hydrolase family 63 C-terminal domain
MTQEELRLQEDCQRKKNWKRWGPYLSERQWGTVREDYSPHGTAWDYLPHDHARSRAYRWGEDGLGGVSDRHQYICFALALWNGKDPILKERLFGLTGNEGNHGEDVKEYYYYLDSTPTHSYMKFLYKYPQAEFPYGRLVEENCRRGKGDLEFELINTGVFDDDRYFDVYIEYAKAGPDDILIRVEATNRGPDAAELRLLPTLWFRNTWSWGFDARKPRVSRDETSEIAALKISHSYYGNRWLYCEGNPEILFAENETNHQRLFGVANGAARVKDGINDYIVHGAKEAASLSGPGTKATAHYQRMLAPGESTTVRLRLCEKTPGSAALDGDFDRIFAERKKEADEFYATVIPDTLAPDPKNIMRQALAGLLWSKQFYHYDVNRWLKGDPGGPDAPAERANGRNREWRHLYNADVISMPDKWEYPWYAAWDLAFHSIALALVDSEFAKEQLLLMTREWYMHPNGQLPAYEWAFGDVNPPVHAWAAWRVYKVEMKRRGEGDRKFLERIFQKLLLNFTWWVNRKDAEGRNVFQGGFLGLDNIGVFDRSAPLPTGGHIEQSDATSWMGMYCLNMLAIALELARENSAYEDVASKFFEHFVYICEAINNLGGAKIELWDAKDGFYYDVLHHDNGPSIPLKVRSMVGLIPLFAVETLDAELVDSLSGFKRRMQWFIENRPEMSNHIETESTESGPRRFLSLVNRHRLKKVLGYMLDESEFLSPYGIRALSRYHRDHPYIMAVNGNEHRVDYEPAESGTGLFGGNSNWRGPIWFPVNYLLVESLQKFHFFLGDSYKVECPTGSGNTATLWQVAGEISQRLTRIFERGEDGRRPVFGGTEKFQTDPHWRDLIPFHEYFHGDNGAGIGASHQTGWTALVAKLIQQYGG